jgi:hypothetical protein
LWLLLAHLRSVPALLLLLLPLLSCRFLASLPVCLLLMLRSC